MCFDLFKKYLEINLVRLINLHILAISNWNNMTYKIEIHETIEVKVDEYLVGYKDHTGTTHHKTLSIDKTHKILNKRQREGLAKGKFRFTITEQHYNLLINY